VARALPSSRAARTGPPPDGRDPTSAISGREPTQKGLPAWC